MGTTLEMILTAPYDYDNDITVSVSHKPDGYQFGCYNLHHGWVFRDANKGLSTPDINAKLAEMGDYGLIEKAPNGQPFTTRWEYRQKNPSWIVFRSWLYVYYASIEVAASGEEGNAYLSICIKLGDDRPNFIQALAWANSQKEGWYQELASILRAYRRKINPEA